MEVYYDLSRLVERLAGSVPSGIDRIDLHYALWTRACASRWIGVLQRPWGVEFLDEAYSASLLDGLRRRWIGDEVGEGVEGSLRQPPGWRREARAAILEKVARAPYCSRVSGRSLLATPPIFLPKLTKKLLLMGQMRARQHDQVSSAGAYWNIGHNFRFERAAEVIAETWSSRSFLFLHDVIPLLYPETQREVSRLHFLRFCQWTTKLDAQLIVSSQSTVAEIERLEGAGFALFGRQINSVIQMPLPVESRFFDTKHAPHRPISEVPFFLIIGTWEKRKNLNILLDVWEQLASERGKKIVLKWVGKRDGMSRKAIARLERLKRDGWIEELGGVSDQTIKELFADARALLFPSLAEGWGLPLAEALAAGLPVIASDLPICREVSQGLAEYQNPSDCSQWIVSVKEFAGLDSSLRLAQLERVQSYQLQLWEAYFDQLADRLKP